MPGRTATGRAAAAAWPGSGIGPPSRDRKASGSGQLSHEADDLREAHSLQAISFGVPVRQHVEVQAYQAHRGAWASQSAAVPLRLQSGQAVSLGVPSGQQLFEQAYQAQIVPWASHSWSERTDLQSGQAVAFTVPVGQQLFEQAYHAQAGAWALH